MNPIPFQLHHIGLLVKSLDVATDNHTSRYGYLIESEIIHDPVQTALLRFLRLPGAPNWLELVAPDGEGSKLSNALAKRGEGLHHLCYEVPDINAAFEHLRAGRQMPLAEPVPAVAFGGRKIAWFMDRAGFLTELVEAGPGPLLLATLSQKLPLEPYK